MSELDEPLKVYDLQVRDEHAQKVSQYFEDLVEKSGIDAAENERLMSELGQLENKVAELKTNLGWLKFFRVALIVVGAICGVVAATKSELAWLYALALACVVIAFATISPKIKNAKARFDEVEQKRKEKVDEAWIQMAPLNSLFHWNDARMLFQSTLPQFKLDPVLSVQKLNDLKENFDLPDDFSDSRSITAVQSGDFRGHPFAVIRFNQHWIGSWTYSGTLTIFWTETFRDSQGNTQIRQRSQVLTASVVKPHPYFSEKSGLLFGHDAAASLHFSRYPSSLSGKDEGKFNSWKKNQKVKSIEKQASKAVKAGVNGLTVMSNRDFEALFNAADRDNEVDFRVMFTPLAQQSMVSLLNDKKIGYGDNFSFIKHQRINFVEPEHLNSLKFECNPTDFQDMSLSRSRKTFNEYHNEYCKAMFFAFAPLLSVPAFHDPRPVVPHARLENHSSEWEHEVIANFIGMERFAHPACITHSMLRTKRIGAPSKSGQVAVTASGYGGYDRVDFIPVLGGDGNWHEVPVPWVEYYPVESTSNIRVNVIEAQSYDSDESTSSGFAVAPKLTSTLQYRVNHLEAEFEG